MITVASLIAAGIKPTQARQFAEPLANACTRFEINTPARLGAFIGQCMVESEGFTHLEECLYYTTAQHIRDVFPGSVPTVEAAQALARNPQALGNAVYGGRLGNGSRESGDGYLFRGRGLLQLTGRSNYTYEAIALNRPYIASPDLVAQPFDAALTAAHYWHVRRLNERADGGEWRSITLAINGRGMQQADLRDQLTQQAIAGLAGVVA